MRVPDNNQFGFGFVGLKNQAFILSNKLENMIDKMKGRDRGGGGWR
jgi:hypothetical protein